MKHKTKPELDRLLDLLDAKGDVQPASLKEARELASHSGARVEIRQGFRKDNDCMKMCFTSEKQAKAAMRRRLNIGSNVSRMRVYFCEACKAHHLTSSIRS